ncbi:GDP-mannose mannosyl hydrolase [Photorhabdus akhurstii]|uniref:GDP-mannose mannosyl hydrolase n=1 Tax=Photorhabdus akhurstii TaxID=171438 RepID=UPI0037045232
MTSANKTRALLNKNSFRHIVSSTPLISIDLVVRNEKRQVLLGHRLNRPAQGYWFVPGGRILKDECLANAFSRLTYNELGIELAIGNANFLGVYEHFYDDNFAGIDFSTHYIVLSYEILISTETLCHPPSEQHSKYCWLNADDLVRNESVHCYTKMYFYNR